MPAGECGKDCCHVQDCGCTCRHFLALGKPKSANRRTVTEKRYPKIFFLECPVYRPGTPVTRSGNLAARVGIAGKFPGEP